MTSGLARASLFTPVPHLKPSPTRSGLVVLWSQWSPHARFEISRLILVRLCRRTCSRQCHFFLIIIFFTTYLKLYYFLSWDQWLFLLLLLCVFLWFTTIPRSWSWKPTLLYCCNMLLYYTFFLLLSKIIIKFITVYFFLYRQISTCSAVKNKTSDQWKLLLLFFVLFKMINNLKTVRFYKDKMWIIKCIFVC